MENNNKLNIGDYILVENNSKNYIGYIYKKIWNNLGLIVKLEIEDEYEDKMLLQNNFNDIIDKKGLMLVLTSKPIKKLNLLDIKSIVSNLIQEGDILKMISKINIKYDIFINSFRQIALKNQSDNNLSVYQFQIELENIKKTITQLFNNNGIVLHNENFYIGNYKSNDFLGDKIENFVKPNLIKILEKFETPLSIGENNNEDENTYYNFNNTLIFKHLITDENDTLSFGKVIINKIKEKLIYIQSLINFDDNSRLIDSTNLFDFLNFKIIGEYIEISKINTEDDQIIIPELVDNLLILNDHYYKPIDYSLIDLIIKNNLLHNLKENKIILEEILNIFSQEYLICFQPTIEFLLWTICRLIISWYADDTLFYNIYKIKILINLYRAKGEEKYNKDLGILPIIVIVPTYGEDNAVKVLSHLSYFFFSYKKLGNNLNKPNGFEYIDNLMYYTNGSFELNKFIKTLSK